MPCYVERHYYSTPLGAVLRRLGAVLRRLGPSWGRLGAVLGRLGGVLGGRLGFLGQIKVQEIPQGSVFWRPPKKHLQPSPHDAQNSSGISNLPPTTPKD